VTFTHLINFFIPKNSRKQIYNNVSIVRDMEIVITSNNFEDMYT